MGIAMPGVSLLIWMWRRRGIVEGEVRLCVAPLALRSGLRQ